MMNAAFVLISNTVFVSSGMALLHLMLKLRITIRDRIMIRIPTKRVPTHPGEMLLEEFLAPMGITQRELAEAIHVPYRRMNELVNRKRGVTPSTALRLARFFNVSADFWLNLQIRRDLYKARQSEKNELKIIRNYHHYQINGITNHSGGR